MVVFHVSLFKLSFQFTEDSINRQKNKWESGRDWRKWLQLFHISLEPSGITEKVDMVKSPTQLHMAGPEALDIHSALRWKHEEDYKLADKGLFFFKSRIL